MSGPPPKRRAERRRRNVSGDESTVVVGEDGALAETKPDGETVPVVLNRGLPVPDPPVGAHAIAVAWYEALKVSGQAIYFEPSDWAAALLVVEVMTRNLAGRRFSAELFGRVWTAMTDLLTTEGARRRVRIEIERKTGTPIKSVSDAAIVDYKRRLTGA